MLFYYILAVVPGTVKWVLEKKRRISRDRAETRLQKCNNGEGCQAPLSGCWKRSAVHQGIEPKQGYKSVTTGRGARHPKEGCWKRSAVYQGIEPKQGYRSVTTGRGARHPKKRTPPTRTPASLRSWGIRKDIGCFSRITYLCSGKRIHRISPISK